MRIILSTCLVLLILLQSFSKAWIVFSFKINQDYIAKVLCINRDRPERHCDGHCVLMQRIKADEERDKKQVQRILKSQQEIVYSFEQVAGAATDIAKEKPNDLASAFIYLGPFTSPLNKGVFHPPDQTKG